MPFDDGWRGERLRVFADRGNITDGSLLEYSGGQWTPVDPADVVADNLSTEQVQDIVGAMIGGDSNITVTYDDGSGSVTVSLNDDVSIDGNFTAGGNIVAEGNITSEGSITVDRNGNSAAATAFITGDAGQFRLLGFLTQNNIRWYIGAETTAESGSNAGSNFVIYRYSDAGGFLGPALTIRRSDGLALLGGTNPITAFPSGTLMLFQQTSAPTGWTKQTTHNNKALRVVSGTASSGGTHSFSTVFGKTATDATTLSEAQLAIHGHAYNQSGFNPPFPAIVGGSGGFHSIWSAAATTNAGSSSSHNHSMDIRVQYVDLIIAAKD